ncbi:hypothetical protein Bca101_073448 [Brassica carinata]
MEKFISREIEESESITGVVFFHIRMTHPIVKNNGEPSFYLFGFIMYCSHSCESAESTLVQDSTGAH